MNELSAKVVFCITVETEPSSSEVIVGRALQRLAQSFLDHGGDIYAAMREDDWIASMSTTPLYQQIPLY